MVEYNKKTFVGYAVLLCNIAGRMDGRMNIKHEKVGKKDNESRDGKTHSSSQSSDRNAT